MFGIDWKKAYRHFLMGVPAGMGAMAALSLNHNYVLAEELIDVTGCETRRTPGGEIAMVQTRSGQTYRVGGWKDHDVSPRLLERACAPGPKKISRTGLKLPHPAAPAIISITHIVEMAEAGAL